MDKGEPSHDIPH